jgi:hypothetical protein
MMSNLILLIPYLILGMVVAEDLPPDGRFFYMDLIKTKSLVNTYVARVKLGSEDQQILNFNLLPSAKMSSIAITTSECGGCKLNPTTILESD